MTESYPVTAQFIQDYMSNQALVQHMDGATQPSSYMCEAMNNCNGNGTCGDNGACICNEGYKFGDCSLKSVELIGGYEASFSQTGPYWYSYYRKNGAKNQELTIQSTENAPVTVYLSLGADSDPT